MKPCLVAFKSFALERISTEKLKATGWHLSVFFCQYTITTFYSSFREAMQMKLGFFVELFCMIIHSIICRMWLLMFALFFKNIWGVCKKIGVSDKSWRFDCSFLLLLCFCCCHFRKQRFKIVRYLSRLWIFIQILKRFRNK